MQSFFMNKIIIFYKYITIENPQQICSWQRTVCEQLNLKGRILIATEGINATVGGAPHQVDQYVALVKEHPLFSDVDFKESYTHSGEPFPKLKVKVRPEIVRLGIDPELYKASEGGTHLSPRETHKLLSSKPDNLVILDARNEFEARVGKFTDAIVPDIENFRDLPEYIVKNEHLFKDKQVLMYCTAGVRCERASAYLKAHTKAQEVYQLEGGVHKYVEEFPDGHFRGKNYVFDGRVTVRITDDILSNCINCTIACDDYINCVNVQCNKHCILCLACRDIMKDCCSNRCLELVANAHVQSRTIPAKTSEPCKVNQEST
jgi:predicted sulfurtransferase